MISVALLGDISESNTAAVGVYVCIASAVSIVAVLLANETRGSTLRHDRVVDEVTTQ